MSALLDEIEEEGGTIIVTKRGRPVATIGPARKQAWKSPKGILAGKVKITGDIVNFRYLGALGCATAGLRIRRFESVISPRYSHCGPLALRSQEANRDQTRVLDETIRHGRRLGVSAISFLEIALLGEEKKRITAGLNDLFHQAMGASLRDPADRVIVATARVYRIPLLTSDQRIVESHLVPVID